MAKTKPKVESAKPGEDPTKIVESLQPLAVTINDLIVDPANAMSHSQENLDAIRGSLRVYGQRKPIVVNRRNNVVEAGNGTLTAARSLGWQRIAVVFVDDDPAVAAGFAIADNRTAQLAEWDEEALDKLLREVETGDEDLQEMLAKLAKEEDLPSFKEKTSEIVEDEVPEPPADPITKPGDLWLLGVYYECDTCGKRYEYAEGQAMKERCPCG